MSMGGQADTSTGREEVSRAYREAGFDETPPEHLDRAILAAARRHRGRRLTSFLPPLALAATVVLAFSIVLQTGVLETDGGAGPSGGDVPTMEALSSDAELDRAAPPDDATTRFQTPAQPSTVSPAQREGPVAPEAAVRARAAPAPSRPLQSPREAVSLEEQAAAVTDNASLGLSATAGADECTAAVRMEPDLWIECIGTRLAEDARDAAARELRLFQDAYPDYPLPPELQAFGTP